MLGLEDGHGGARPSQDPGGVDPRVPAADDDDVGGVGQLPVAYDGTRGIDACQYGRRS